MSKLWIKLMLGINITVFAALFLFWGAIEQHLPTYYYHSKFNKLKRVAEKDLEDPEVIKISFPYVAVENQFNLKLRDALAKDKVSITKLWYIKKDIETLLKGRVITRNYVQPKTNHFVLTVIKAEENEVKFYATYLSSTREVLQISRKFFIFTLAFPLLISSIVISYIAFKIIDPINSLKKVAKDVKNLKFTQCSISTGDELEELGDDINEMSIILEKSINNLRDFISMASHELKTPLTIMKGYTHALKDEVDEENKDFFYNIIIEENEKMESIINKLLYISKVDKLKTGKDFSNHNILNIFMMILKKYSADVGEKKIEVDIQGNMELDCSKEDFVVVLENMLSNAISFVNYNGKIEIKLSKDNITIYNTGSHIPEENLKNIWEPFFKVDKSGNRKYGGTGLGLSLCKKILDEHKFKYFAHNRPDGVEFVILTHS